MSSVIWYLYSNQPLHNHISLLLFLMGKESAVSSKLGDTRFVLCDGNRWAFFVKLRLYVNVNGVSPESMHDLTVHMQRGGVLVKGDKKWPLDATIGRSSLLSVFQCLHI